jgi:tetratricopeptide (TPR) repeat protein
VLARALMERGSLEEAEAEFLHVLAQSPENLVVVKFLGDICAKAGRGRQARDYYERALRLKPGDPEAQERLAALPTGEGPGASGRPERDPLASPTLAALYTAQGHTDIAKAIYSYLGRTGTETIVPPAEKGSPPLLDMLLAFRKAAHMARHESRGR